MDAGNLLKPMLARGELHCIGATTLDEYRKHIEKDAALERRFQPVMVDQPTVEDTISILRGLQERYEVHHGVRIKDAALVAAAVLSQPLHHRPLPARQGHRPGGRGGGASCAPRSTRCRPSWTRSPRRDHAARDRARGAEEGDATPPRGSGWRSSRRSWPTCKAQADALRAQWERGEGGHRAAARSCASSIEEVEARDRARPSAPTT